ncbi:uncharacterized protein KIAA0513-like [Oppia nitens]|uniref:uncharacterized protein KIAA0513-like n=1 Tax=Oppia nitens TaxID=1686743 RepID=UPI0023DB05D9|nr:uncharacterized protein KIAA0513-like [Oppia nitens]
MTTNSSSNIEDKPSVDINWEEKSSPRFFGSEKFWGFKDNLFSGLSSKLEAALQAGFDVAFTDNIDNTNNINDNDIKDKGMVTSNSSASFSRKSKDRSVFGQPEINYQNQSLHRNKGQSLESLDTLDSGQSMGSSCTSVSEIQLRNLEIQDSFKYYYKTTESLGIGSGQSTSLESSDAEDDGFKRCDSRQSAKSSVSSVSGDSQLDESYISSKIFMKNFVSKVFSESNAITLEEKSIFGEMCRKEFGRLWFARYINEQRVHNKKVKETTFYSLAQYFAIVLFECSESDDFTPAKTLMNMCFTYYHESYTQLSAHTSSRCHKQYLYNVLREQPIWRSLRFWNAAFFDALQCERANRPTPTQHQLIRYNSQEMTDENKFQQNITFGQLGAFIHNMHSFGLPKELCTEFLRKQSTIANLPQEQISTLRENIEHMYSHK